MSISGISPLAASTPTVTTPTDTATTNGASSSATNPTDALLAPNQFLTLLVDSLKYQDPLDPTSSADFLQQLASLSQVQTESQVAQTDQTSAAANLIGHTVTGNDPSGTSISGLVTGFSMTSSGPDLDIGNDSVSLGTISSVGPAPTADTTSTTAPSTTAPSTTTPSTTTPAS